MLLKKIQNSLPAVNVASSFVRAVGRGFWGLAIPAIMSVTNFGVYSILQTTASILAQISVLGTSQTILREPKKELPLVGFLVHSITILCVAFLIAYLILPKQDMIFYVLLFVLSSSFILYSIVGARSKSRLLFKRVFLAEAVGSVALLCGLPILLVTGSRGGGNYVNYSLALPFEILSTLVVIVALISKTGLTSSELKTRGTFTLLPSIYSVGFLVLFDIAIWRRIEIYFLEKSFEGLTGVAIFSLASQLGVLFMILPGSILEAWLPGFAESFTKSKEAYNELLNRRFKKFVMLYVFFIISVPVFGVFLMKFLFLKYSQWMFYIISIIMIRVVCGFFAFYSSVLYATKNERSLYLPVTGSAVISLAANSIFTLHYGLRGLLAAYSLTQLFVSVATFFAYKKKVKSR